MKTCRFPLDGIVKFKFVKESFPSRSIMFKVFSVNVPVDGSLLAVNKLLLPDLSDHEVTILFVAVIVLVSAASAQSSSVNSLGNHGVGLELADMLKEELVDELKLRLWLGIELEDAPLELVELEGLLSFPKRQN
jgi:hypothetical protein